MLEIINKLSKSKKVIFKDNSYEILSITKYTTINSPGRYCYKIFLSNKNEIVVLPDDNLVLFGRDYGKLEAVNTSEESFIYKNVKYNMTIHDIQYVAEQICGDEKYSEGKVEFWDFDAENGLNSISLGIDLKTGDRCDVIATVINKDELIILE